MLIILNELGRSFGSNCCGAQIDMAEILRGRRETMKGVMRRRRGWAVWAAGLWMGSRGLG